MPSGVTALGAKEGSGSERRGSTSSEGSATSGSTHGRSLSMETAEYLQAARSRASTAAPPKPAANPLQFVKVKPCQLYRSAQEQLKKAEEVKKHAAKDRRQEQEDWQSNLDNWKSSRRKQVEHIIERCVEVKRLELEESDRNRSRRSKTFNEMMEDRAGRRNARTQLTVYCEEDNNDLSDLGIGTSSTSGKSSLSEDCDNHSLVSDGMDLEKNHSDIEIMSSSDTGNRKLGSSANEYDTCTTATISSPEPEEYTYEGAIENYKSRIISRTQSSDVILPKFNGVNGNKERSPDNVVNGLSFKKPNIGSKIENKLSSYEQKRGSNVEANSTDVNKKPIPKIDISKKRELFEKENSPEQNGLSAKTVGKATNNFVNKKSIKERFSHLEKFTEDSNSTSKPNGVSKPVSVKERLNSLEKSVNENDKTHIKLSNGDLTSVSIKDRLFSLNSKNASEKPNVNTPVTPEITQSLKDRLANLDSASKKEITKQLLEDEFDQTYKVNGFEKSKDNSPNEIEINHHNGKIKENGMHDSKRLHRSMDNLDKDDVLSNKKFEKIQSMEDLCGDNSTGADTDHEDSGIHTGDVSCAVSQDEEPVNNSSSSTVFKKSTISQDTVINSDSVIVETVITQNIGNINFKEEFTNSVSITSNIDNEPQEDNSEPFFDKEEDDTVKSMDADNSVFDALDCAFELIDTEEPITNNAKMSNPITVDENISPADIVPNTDSVLSENSIEDKLVDTKKSVEVSYSNSAPLYENIEIFYSNTVPLVNSDVIGFPLGPPINAMQPPKEKPPPPPVEEIDEVDEPLKRMNSTKRIKKEIRNKRSSFLGIEGIDDDTYLESELKLAPRPDITTFLREESRVEKNFKKSLYYDSDSNLGESRDSGVELDRGHSDDLWSNKQTSPETLSEQHSRQGSEPFTNTSLTSEEDNLLKRDKELNANEMKYFFKHDESQDVMSHQLTTKLKELEQEKNNLIIASRSEDEKLREDENRIRALDEQRREQQSKETNDRCDVASDDGDAEEVLRVERELLQLEQEELKRQRDNLLLKESQTRRMNGRSLQDINTFQSYSTPLNKTSVYPCIVKTPSNNNHRQSMPNLAAKQPDFSVYSNTNNVASYNSGPKSSCQPIKKLLPPIPPVKPARSIEMQEREITLRNSRVPSAEYSNIEELTGRPKSNADQTKAPVTYSHSQMSRHTLQALSAAPRSRLIPAADWLQPKRRSEPPQNYNYNQHWLIQEAEQRRIDQLRNNIKKQSQAASQVPGTKPKHLPDAVIQTLTQRVQNMNCSRPLPPPQTILPTSTVDTSEKMLSVSGKKKCSHCGEELGRGAAMIIESLRLFYHLKCFQCCVCGVRLGDGRLGADVRVRHNQLHCHNCYSSDDGVKFSCV